MIHYTLMKPAVVPKRFGINKLESFLQQKLNERYIDLFDTFDEDTIVTTEMVNAEFTLPTDHELKTVELIVNPYNRAFLAYLNSLGTVNGNSTEQQIRDVATESDFEDYIRSVYEDPSDYNRINQSSGIRNDVNYILHAESYAADLAKIPDLSTSQDLSDALNGYDVIYNNLYREYYTQNTHTIVGEMYAQDIEKYGYTF